MNELNKDIKMNIKKNCLRAEIESQIETGILKKSKYFAFNT